MLLFTTTGPECSPTGSWRENCAEDNQKPRTVRHHVKLPPICISSITTGQCNFNLPTTPLVYTNPAKTDWVKSTNPNRNALQPLAAFFDADHQTLLCLLTPLSVLIVVLQDVNDYCNLKWNGYGMMNKFLEFPPCRKKDWEKKSKKSWS